MTMDPAAANLLSPVALAGIRRAVSGKLVTSSGWVTFGHTVRLISETMQALEDYLLLVNTEDVMTIGFVRISPLTSGS